MKDSIKERIKIFVAEIGITLQKLEKQCGFSNGYINGASENGYGIEKLNAIFREYPNLSKLWLNQSVAHFDKVLDPLLRVLLSKDTEWKLLNGKQIIFTKEYDNKISYKELLQILGKNWKKLSDEKREKYLKLESIEKQKFLELKKDKEYHYKPSKKLKEPKRFRTAYMFYLQDNKSNLSRMAAIAN